MKKDEKRLNRIFSFLFLFGILFLNSVSAEIVEVNSDSGSGNTGIFSGFVEVLKSPIFWGAIVIFSFVTIVLVGLFFVVRALMKYIKTRSDAFWRLKSERIKLSKIHRRYPSTHWLKVSKNTPIRLVRVMNGVPTISKPIGYHRGDYVTHEGNFILSLNLQGMKKWLFFPVTDVLVIPNKEMVSIVQKGKKGEKTIVNIDNLPKPSDIVHFNENEILIYAESLSFVGLFLVPVMKAKDGKVLDLSMPVYNSLKQVVLEDYLFEQTSEFGVLAKQSMNINPFMRGAVKLQDSSQSVDIPSQNDGK